METLLSISLLVALTLWAGLALATFLGKLVANLLPFMKTPGQASGQNTAITDAVAEQDNELAMVA